MTYLRFHTIFCASLLISFLIVTPFHAVRAQKVTICVDFNATDDITESDGRDVHITPSGLSASDQSAIISQVQSLFEAVFGKGNITVQNAADGACNGKFVLIDSGAGPGREYGDANRRTGNAVVHIGAYVNQGFTGDTLIRAIGESVAHEAAHLLGIDHNTDTMSLMVPGDSISVATRMADHRKFTSKDSARLVQLLALGNTVPSQGSFAVSAPIGTSPLVPYDLGTEIIATPSNTAWQVGYYSVGGNFIPAWQLDDLRPSSYSLTMLGNEWTNIGYNWNGQSFNQKNYGSYYVAQPNPSSSGTYMQGLISFDRGPAAGNSIFLDLRSPQSSSGILPTGLNPFSWSLPHAGNIVGHNISHDFDVLLTPNYLDVEGFDGAGDTWYPPEGLEIVDGKFTDEYVDHYTGNDVAHYTVLLSDGSIVFLRFESCDVCGDTWGTTVGGIPNIPFLGYGTATHLEDGPITVFGANSIFRYDAAQSKWVVDTSGMNGSYVQGIAGDSWGKLFAATSNGIYTQQNTSLTWTLTSQQNSTNSVYCDRTGRIFAATFSGIFVSTDHGISWNPGPSGFPSNIASASFDDDAFGTIYAIANNYTSPSQLYRSTGGTSPWVQIAQSVTAQVYDPSSGLNFNRIQGDTTLYLSTKFGLYQSTDHGTTWTENDAHVQTSSNYSLAKNFNGQLLLGTDAGIFTGYYGDTAWKKIWPTTGTFSQNGKPVYVDNSGIVYTLGPALYSFSGFSNSIARSLDGGSTWGIDSASKGVVTQNGIYFADPTGTEYMGTYGSTGVPVHIYSRTKQGTWSESDNGFVTPASSYPSPTAFGFDGSSAYFSVTDSIYGLLWKKTGSRWSLDTAGLNRDQIYSFAWNGTTFVAGGAVGLYVQNGNHWNSIPLPKDRSGSYTYYVAEDNSGAIFSSFYNYGSNGNFVSLGVYFTKDQGQHWTQVFPSGLQINGLHAFGDTAYVISTKGVFAYTSRLWATSYIPEGNHGSSTLTTIDAGSIPSGTMHSVPIRITNFGNDSLRISGYSSSNSSVTLTATPAVVAPGEVLPSSIDITPSSNGALQATLVVTSNSTSGHDTIFVNALGGAPESVGERSPDILSLQNYPNPFGISSTITYSLANEVPVSLTVTDVLGRAIGTLVNDREAAGSHSVDLNGSDLPDGIYILVLRVGSSVLTKQISIVH